MPSQKFLEKKFQKSQFWGKSEIKIFGIFFEKWENDGSKVFLMYLYIMKIIITEGQLGMIIKESKGDVYFDTYSGAVRYAMDDAKSKGYEIDQSEVFSKVAVGSKKPSIGKTTKVSLGLMKGGKESKKMLHIQVYGMEKKYELNFYIN